MDRKATLHNFLSQVISANAIFPPRNSDDIKVFDIVKIRATGPPDKMLEYTDVSLCDVLPPDEKEYLEERIETRDPSANEKRLSTVSN